MNSPGTLHEIRRICVFCGSNIGRDGKYQDAAREFGRALVARGWEAVYGGGRVGLMGVFADEVLAQGGHIIGVIPEMLATKELVHNGATQMHVVASMHARKALMAELADAFVALPGGFGTFEETLEMITWGQLGIHSKPLGLLDVLGFYRPLAEFIEHAVSENFVRPEQRNLFVMSERPDELLELLARQRLPIVRKWIGAEDT